MNSMLTILTLSTIHPLIYAQDYIQQILTWIVGTNVEVIGNRIIWEEPGDPGATTTKEVALRCNTPTVVSLTADQKYFARCSPGQRLVGGPETVFASCADGYDLAGSAAVGYGCCPTGQVFDGAMCKEEPKCPDGQVFVGGQCQCPPGQAMGAGGVCETPQCDSGLTAGKCYTFITELGIPMGLHANGNLFANTGSMQSRPSKFQRCKDQGCTAGKSIHPGDTLYIRDLYGDIPTGANRGKWINNAANGDHMQLIADFNRADKLTLTKWPCGEYCLAGIESGVGPACPAEAISLTMYSQDPNMCVPFKLIEVPCDPKALENNCIWTNPDEQCAACGLAGSACGLTGTAM